MFVCAKYFKPILLFGSEDRVYSCSALQKALLCVRRLLVIYTNIGLVFKSLHETNTLAYFSEVYVVFVLHWVSMLCNLNWRKVSYYRVCHCQAFSTYSNIGGLGQLLTLTQLLPYYIRPGWKCLQETNTLAYHVPPEKHFIIFSPGPYHHW